MTKDELPKEVRAGYNSAPPKKNPEAHRASLKPQPSPPPPPKK
jgi:hypothetical protein